MSDELLDEIRYATKLSRWTAFGNWLEGVRQGIYAAGSFVLATGIGLALFAVKVWLVWRVLHAAGAVP